MAGRKIRLLRIAFNDLGHGGIQSQFMDVTKRLNNEVASDLIVWSSKTAFYDEEFQKYGRIFYCPHYEGPSAFRKKIDYFVRYFKVKKTVYEIITKYGPYDVVHCHKFFECAPCLAAAKKAGVPIRIAHSHNTAIPKKRIRFNDFLKDFYNGVYRRIIRKNATSMIGCSQRAADYLFGPGYGRAVYNAIDLDIFNRNMYQKSDHYGPRFIHVGNFNFQKNQLFLVDVFYELKKHYNDATLTMVGQKSDYYNKVIERIKELNLETSVHILPHYSNIPQVLNDNDIFVFPSTFEGFGNVLIEAQAMGLKCFVSDQITPEADCGLLTYISLDYGAKYWANQILSYVEEEGLKKHDVDVSRFSPENNSQEMLNLYNGSGGAV